MTHHSDAAERFDTGNLRGFAQALLSRAGLPRDRARDVAEVLVEGDLLGHDTHGLNLLAGYLGEIERGAMQCSGDIETLSERTSIAAWDGHRLPGPWLVRQALRWAVPRAREHGAATVTIRHSHHIGCLAAYLIEAASEGLLTLVSCSDPAAATVAPFGGTRALFSPNPVAVGIPSREGPVLIDISASVTTNGMSARLRQAGVQGEHEWWLDAEGRPTRDPEVLWASPPGSILPLGGTQAGHKGYGLALMIEALTACLAGHGRADAPRGWGATVWLQLYDPSCFAGQEAFLRQSDWIVSACRDARPADPRRPVRLPGQRALALRDEQLKRGVALHAAIMPQLVPWALKLGIDLPPVLAFPAGSASR